MATSKAQRAGGKASAVKQRDAALANYYANPNYCRYCGNVIEVPEGVKVAEIRRKQYCNSSCFASASNPKRKRVRKLTKLCACGKPIKDNNTRCTPCHLAYIREQLNSTTKGELFSKRSGWQSARSSIRRHAAQVFSESNLSKNCYVCGYSRHIEVAHIVPVSEFPDSATLAEINNPRNLVGLCPTHHWEYDAGILNL